MSVFPTIVTGLVLVLVMAGAVLVLRRYPIFKIYRSKQHLESTFDSINDPLAIISESYELSRVNKAYAAFVNRPFPAILGKKCHEVLFGRAAPCDICRLKHVLASAQKENTEHFPYTAKGPERIISLHFYPFSPKAAALSRGVVEHIRDITQLERLKEDLESQNKELIETTEKLETAQREIHDEIELARRVHASLLPRELPKNKWLKIQVVYNPIQAIGGDIYDFIPFGPTKLGVFIGDASGHGLPAAFVGAISKISLYNHTQKFMSTKELINQVHLDLMHNIPNEHYLTGFWGIFDFETGIITYTRASHPKPVVIRNGFDVYQLQTPGTFIGMIEEPGYGEASFEFRKDDRFYFFTDGIYEAFDKANHTARALGYRRFQDILIECNSKPFDEVIPAIQEKLSRYRHEDDYTFILMEIIEHPTGAVT